MWRKFKSWCFNICENKAVAYSFVAIGGVIAGAAVGGIAVAVGAHTIVCGVIGVAGAIVGGATVDYVANSGMKNSQGNQELSKGGGGGEVNRQSTQTRTAKIELSPEKKAILAKALKATRLAEQFGKDLTACLRQSMEIVEVNRAIKRLIRNVQPEVAEAVMEVQEVHAEDHAADREQDDENNMVAGGYLEVFRSNVQTINNNVADLGEDELGSEECKQLIEAIKGAMASLQDAERYLMFRRAQRNLIRNPAGHEDEVFQRNIDELVNGLQGVEHEVRARI